MSDYGMVASGGAQSGRSGPWTSPLYQLPERNKESRKNGGFYRAGARCSEKED
jgi:hypothetical protein